NRTRGGRDRGRACGGRKKGGARGEPIAPSADWAIVGLSVLGLIVAGYLTWLKWSAGAAFLCKAGSGCDLVQASRYSILLWVPTALWGALLYIAVGVLAGLGLTQKRGVAAFVLVSGGGGLSGDFSVFCLFDVGGPWRCCVPSRSATGDSDSAD